MPVAAESAGARLKRKQEDEMLAVRSGNDDAFDDDDESWLGTAELLWGGLSHPKVDPERSGKAIESAADEIADELVRWLKPRRPSTA